MKRLCIILLTAVVIAGASCSGRTIKSGNPGFQYFKVAFEQDGVVRDIENNTVKLKKKPFTIIVSFTDKDGLFVSASVKPDSYTTAANGEKLEEIPGFSGPGLDEELFNKDETLAVSATIPNYWNYTDDNDHRFSEIIVKPDVIICRRNISHLNFIDYRKKTEISAMKEKEIYCVFMKMEWNKDFSSKIEIKREFVKLEFSAPDKNEVSTNNLPHQWGNAVPAVN